MRTNNEVAQFDDYKSRRDIFLKIKIKLILTLFLIISLDIVGVALLNVPGSYDMAISIGLLHVCTTFHILELLNKGINAAMKKEQFDTV